MSEYQRCTRCVIEASPRANVTFDEHGVCNNCKAYDTYVQEEDYYNYAAKAVQLEKIIKEIKQSGEGKQYDCILGISGGVDSTYLAYLAKKYGLRPLVVHFDNGWNTELAVQNIYNVINYFGFDLHTYVINWEEFSDLQLAYIKASVIDIEIPTDHFIYATLHEVAHQNKIKYILDGNNVATEFSGCSMKWGFSKLDLVNLKNIHKKFGTVKLKKYPRLGLYQRFFYQEIMQIKSVRLNDYVPYERNNVVKVLESQLGWKNPGGKHYESIFTRFYQGYILPNKFGVDKRTVHLSNLIWSHQIARDEALAILAKPTYPLELQMQDKAYLIKKMKIKESEFEEYMQQEIIEHETYGTEAEKVKAFSRIKPFIRKPLRALVKFGILR